MAYTFLKRISLIDQRLEESQDLTVLTASLIRQDHYIVVANDHAQYVLSISKILDQVPGLDLSKSIVDLLRPLLSDVFVQRYHAPHIPISNARGSYRKGLQVFNPISNSRSDVKFTSINTPHIENDPKQKGYLDDLVITNDQPLDNCLAAVNGVFHRTVMMQGKLYVLDGFRTIRVSNKRDITLVDTAKLGGHTIIPLTPHNTTLSAYQQMATVRSDISLLGKTVFAVIDGYFYHRSAKVVEFAGEHHVRIRTSKLPLVSQFRHNPRTLYQKDRFGEDAPQSSRKYSDTYSALFLSKPVLTSEELATQAFQYSRLTHYHSFLVVINNPNLFTYSTPLTPTGTPQLYSYLGDNSVGGMISYNCGLCPSYLLWNDVHDRKHFFLSAQDHDVDFQDATINPVFVPPLLRYDALGKEAPADLIDYVSA